MLWAHLLGALWTSAFFTALGDCSVAHAVAGWYFCRDRKVPEHSKKKKTGRVFFQKNHGSEHLPRQEGTIRPNNGILKTQIEKIAQSVQTNPG